MVRFKQKEFGKALGYLKDHPTIPLSAATLAISGVNLGVNSKRQKEAKEIADKQLGMMKKQVDAVERNTRAIQDNISTSREVSDSLRKGFVQPSPKPASQKRKRFKLFSEESRNYSIKSATIAGAELGFGIGSLGSIYAPKSLSKFKKEGYKFYPSKKKETIGGHEVAGEYREPKINDRIDAYDKLSPFQKKSLIIATTTIIGAALGALVGTIGEIDKKVSRSSVTGDRLMKGILSNLQKDNFKEGVNFTRDPKIADKLKTKVCIAVSRSNGDLRVLINTKSDPKLKEITNNIVKHIPNAGVTNKTASNNYNEITISTISDSSADSTLVSGIASSFIHSGYPVYLVEVG